MIELTKIQKFILLGAGLVVVVVVIGLYFAFKPKSAPKTDSPPKTDAPPKTESPPKTDSPPKYAGRIYLGGMPMGGMSIDEMQIIMGEVVFIHTDNSQIGFYKEELLYNGGCWTINSENEKWKNLRSKTGRSIIKSIKLPTGIKATAYKLTSDAINENYDPCDDKYKIMDINADETKNFNIGSVYGFKFTDAPPKYTGRIFDPNIVGGSGSVVDVVFIHTKDNGQVGFYKEELLYNGGRWTLDSNEKWGLLRVKGGLSSNITSITLPAGIKATAYGSGYEVILPLSDDKEDRIIFDVKAGETRSFDKGSVYGFKFSKV